MRDSGRSWRRSGPTGTRSYVTDLAGENATVVVRKRVSGESAVERAASDLRLRSPSGWRRPAVTPRRRRDDFDLHPRAPGTEAEARRPDQAAPPRRRRRRDDPHRDRGDRRHVGLGAGTALSAELRPEHAAAGRDRPELVRLRSRRIAARLDPRRAKPRARRDSRKMSPWLPRATIAIEDRRFWQHGGVDYVGIARAAWKDVTAGKVVEGGSTITQQLVRNLYTGQEKTFTRKLKEACLAIKLASKWPKPRDPRRVPEHRLLRQPRVRRRGRLADLLLEAREPADAARRRRCSPGCRRPRRSTTRSTTRRRRSTAATRCCARC